MKNIEQNLGKYVIDNINQKDKDLKLFVDSINLKKEMKEQIITKKKQKKTN